MQISDLRETLSLPSQNIQHIEKLLKDTNPQVVYNWLSKLKIVDGRLQGTFYAELGDQMPFSSFIALYRAIGYDVETMATWMDWWCYGAEGCKRQTGYTCNPDECP